MRLLKFFTPLLFALFIITSCSEDDSFNPTNNPTSDLVAVSATTIPANGTFTVDLTASQGDNPLSMLTIRQDGNIVSAGSITIDNVVQTLNPLPLTGALQTSFDFTITIQTDLSANQTSVYTFFIEAENGDNTTETISISTDALVPELTVVGGDTDYLTSPGVLVTVPIEAVKGSADLSTLSVYQNGSLINAGRISFGTTTWTANPRDLTGDEIDGFEEDLVIEAQSSADTSLYLVELIDDNGIASFIEFYIVTGTPIDSTKTRLYLYNSAGPDGQGGVNLISGASTNSDAADAHLIDLGIDINLPIADNWLQLITDGMATATLRITTGVDFDQITTKEEIQDIFDDATTIGATQKISGGEILVLETNAGAYILVRIDSVNIVTTDNSDYYELTAKF